MEQKEIDHIFRHPKPWLRNIFECELCGECGGDWHCHTVTANALGLPHALCLTPVVFRADRSGSFKGDVTAVFPTDCANMRGSMGCFEHVGQHSACDWEWYCGTRTAKPEEYAELKRELEAAPYRYRLKVYKRIQPWMRDAINRQLDSYREKK